MGLNLTTLLFEIVNFLVLVLVLHRFVYRPLRNAIAARREELDGARVKVDEERELLSATRSELEEGRHDLAALRIDVRREAIEGVTGERTRILEQAHEDAAAERARVRALLDSERKMAEQWVRSTVVEKATEVAGRLLMRLAPDAVDRALRDGLVEAIGRNAERLLEQRLGPSPEVEVTGAVLPTDEVVGALREALSGVLGGVRPRLAVREDETLEAGLVLRVDNVILDASLRGQLAAYRDLAESLFLEKSSADAKSFEG